MSTIEIIVPVRNPTAVIEQTARSLAAQTDRGFSVLLSDNHSTAGAELITAAAARVAAAGIAVRQVKPPVELGRVEHWNWAHHESAGDWLKPLFAGDWLEPEYVASLRAGIGSNPECRYVFTAFVYHRGDTRPETVKSAWSGRFRTAAEMQQVVLRNGMQFGPPSAAAYERTAFLAVGGYPSSLPICSDNLLFCTLASRYGALGLAEPLCHFNIHGARFSMSLPQKRKATFQETLTLLWMLGYHAWTEKVKFSRLGFLRLLLRETRAYWRGK